MSYFTEQIRTQIDQENLDSAMGNLISSLKSGDKRIYDRAVALSRKLKRSPRDEKTYQGKAVNPPKKQLQTFLRQLEQKHKPMLSFIESVKLANQYFEQGSWVKAIQNYQNALELHQSKFQLNRESLTSQIELCQNALAYNYQLDMGEECLNQGIWSKAITHFNQARSAFNEALPYDVKKLESQLLLAKHGRTYEHYIDLGRGLKSQLKWKESREAFQQALTYFHDGFIPEKEWLENAIEECELLEKEVASTKFFSVKRLWMTNRGVFIWGGTVSLILVVYFLFALPSYDFETAPGVEAGKKAASVIESITPKSNKADGPKKTDDDKISSEDIAEATTEVSPQTDEALVADTVIKEEQNSVNSEDVEVIAEDRSPDEKIANDVAIIEELDIAEIDEDELIAEESEEILPNDEQIASADPSPSIQKIAVIPFCDGINDPGLLKRLYMDATFALSKSELNTISKNMVNGKVKELNLNQNQSCSKLHNSRLGRALHADFLLTGSVARLANDQVQISCKVLELSTGTFSQEIIVIDKDIDALRAKLKNEIPNLFSKGL